MIFSEMAEREEWCSNQISKLMNEELRISTLNEIKDYFANISQDEAIRTAKSMELSLVFDCLNDTNTEQVDLACDVLSLCMSNLSLGDTTNRYSTPLERALNHPHSSVKIMALKEIQRNLSNEELLVSISRQHNLICSVLQCVGDENLSVAKVASAVILELGKSSYGIQQLLFSDCLKIIQNVMASNEIVRMRFNEIFIDICTHSEKFMQVLSSVGLLQHIFKDLDSNDVLLKLNVIELLSHLAVTEHGYHYLESHGVVTKIFETNDDPLTSQLVEPAMLKFFGHIAHWKPTEMLTKYPQLLHKLLMSINSDDPTVLGVMFDTIGHIGESNEGKLALESTAPKLISFISVTLKNQISYATDLRIRALGCIENLFRMLTFDSETTKLVLKWFDSINEAMDVVYKIAQNPFSEIRLAGLGILNALTSHQWGQEQFRNTPGLIEYLLDRRSETFKECKEAKYEIIRILSGSAVFDDSTQRRLQEYVREGPFYVQALTEVAIEGED